MAKKKTPKFWSKVGVWSYIAGLAIALLVALFTVGLEPWSMGVLAILGLIVGLVNIADSEVKLYLIGAIAFIISAGAMIQVFGNLGVAFSKLQTFMEHLDLDVTTLPGGLLGGTPLFISDRVQGWVFSDKNNWLYLDDAWIEE